MDKATLIKRNATIAETVNLIKQAAKEASRRPFTLKAANKISSLKELHDFVYNLAVYREDPPGKQLIRTPERLKRDGIGNCVDYSTAVSAILQAKGIPHKLRVTGYNGESYSHIYPVVKNSPIDVAAGQLQDGSETMGNRSKPAYNFEAPYTIKKDYKVMPDVYILQGYTPKNKNDLFTSIGKEFDTSGSKCDNVFSITGGSIRKAWKLLNRYYDAVVKADAAKVDQYIKETGIKPDNSPEQFQRFLNNSIQLPLSENEVTQLYNRFIAESKSISGGALCNKSRRTQNAIDYVNNKFDNYVPSKIKFYHFLVMQNTKEYKGRYNYLLLSQTGSALASAMGIPQLFPFGTTTSTTTPGTPPTVTAAGFSETAIFLGAGLLLTYLFTLNDN